MQFLTSAPNLGGQLTQTRPSRTPEN